MGFTRRDLLKFTGGSAAGLCLTPVPWGLLRDSSIVSENWPGVPQPKRREVRTAYTTCTLCPAGCGVRARMNGDQPVSLAGVAAHPEARGALCPIGVVGHHFAFCRQRAYGALADSRPASVDHVLASVSAAIAACGPQDTVAILDPRPGRVASTIYRRFLARLPRGIHCAPPGAQPFGSYGIDLENTRTILSFGAPVLDGWLSPGRVLANRSHFQLIQVEAACSRTASLADFWVPILPGTEDAFADAVVRALHGDGTDAKAAEVARLLTRNQPAIAVGRTAAAAKLNAALSSIGHPGGFVLRRDFTPPTDIAALPDGSIHVLLIEEATAAEPAPWDVVRRKLLPHNSVVVALTPWLDGSARRADYVVPAPVYLEALDEAPTAEGSTEASFSLSPALRTPPPNLIQPAEFVQQLAQASASYFDSLKQRVAEIQKDGRGTVLTYAGGKSTPLKEIPDLWKTMLAGAVWRAAAGLQDCEGPPGPAPQTVEPTPEYPLILLTNNTPPSHGTPLMSKLYRESGLLRPANAVALNPKTARDQGLENGCRAILKTPAATSEVQVIIDPAVMPGTVEVAGQAGLPAAIRRA